MSTASHPPGPHVGSPAPAGAVTTQPGSAGDQSSSETFATLDLFTLARRANAARDAALGHAASFVRTRQLLATGAWRGPRDAALSFVEQEDLDALGGWTAAATAGAELLLTDSAEALRDATATGAAVLWRLPYRSGEPASERAARIAALRDLCATLPVERRPWGVVPTPSGEPEGLDTLHLTATLRLELPQIAHVIVDVGALGPRLAQMALGFGTDELWAPIVSERALRLGANANNPAMTRKEATILIRGAGLTARERMGGDRYEEVTP